METRVMGMQSNEADELARRSFFDRPEAPASLVYESHDSLGKRVTLLSRPGRWIVTHDIGVGIHCRERLQVGLPPLPERETGSDEWNGMVQVGRMNDVRLCIGCFRAFAWVSSGTHQFCKYFNLPPGRVIKRLGNCGGWLRFVVFGKEFALESFDDDVN